MHTHTHTMGWMSTCTPAVLSSVSFLAYAVAACSCISMCMWVCVLLYVCEDRCPEVGQFLYFLYRGCHDGAAGGPWSLVLEWHVPIFLSADRWPACRLCLGHNRTVNGGALMLQFRSTRWVVSESGYARSLYSAWANRKTKVLLERRGNKWLQWFQHTGVPGFTQGNWNRLQWDL